MSGLTLAVAQPFTVPYDVHVNARAHAELIRAAEARVVVFPELSLTGYELDAPTVNPGDDRLEPIIAACAATGTLALVGAPVGGPHIAMLAVEGTGVSVAYQKMFLGGAEPERFVPGGSPAVLKVDGVRLGLALCKDTGVPQHAHDTAARGIDAYLAGVCHHPAESAEQDERVRRVVADHGVWVAIASFAGATGGGYAETAGRSAIWSPGGTPVARAGEDPGELVKATL
jgi:predicted amidohydrolase